MEKKDVVVTLVATLLGILSAVLGFAAEVKRVKTVEVRNDGGTIRCNYPSSLAGDLGLAAAALLVVAQIVIHASSGCLFCRKRARAQAKIYLQAWIVFVFSWIAFIVGLSLLLRASALNRNGDLKLEGIVWMCYVVRQGVSAGGATLALISVSLGIVHYHLVARLKKTVEAQDPQLGQAIPMAQPQFPSQPPVFVHEDTYNRRHIP